ncbi:MAG: hypothetical protein IRY91_01815 [Gemmatimonadaceae bacterium]|nr:hypothetical protein [Gemmatimonadaceae bacterium]
MPRGTRRSRRLSRAVLGAAVLVIAPAAGAQTRFAWPARPAPVEQYGRPEECLAAVERSEARAVWGARPDTLSAVAQDRASEPPEVIEIARRCSAHLDADRMPASSRPLYLQLLLIAGRDSTFAAVVDKQVAEARSVDARSTALFSAFDVLLRARPVRIAAAEQLAQRLDALGPEAAESRLYAWFRLAYLARLLGDSALLARAAPRALALGSRVDSANPNLIMKAALSTGVVMLTPPRPLDVLRDSGPDAYVQLIRRKYVAEATKRGVSRDTAENMVENDLLRGAGRPAPPLVGDYWYGRSDTTRPLPARGRVTLLAFVDHRCRVKCYPGYAMLERLHRRFGDALDIVLVAQTFGYFRLRPPPSPSEEAELIRHYFLDELKLPGMLTVSVTPTSQLPAPDRRHVYGETANGRSYHVSPSSTEQETALRLVGPTGTILYAGDVYLQGETDLTNLIAAAIEYQKKTSASSVGDGR